MYDWWTKHGEYIMPPFILHLDTWIYVDSKRGDNISNKLNETSAFKEAIQYLSDVIISDIDVHIKAMCDLWWSLWNLIGCYRM